MRPLIEVRVRAWLWLTSGVLLLAGAAHLAAGILPIEPVEDATFVPTYTLEKDILVDLASYGDAISDPARNRVYISVAYRDLLVANISQGNLLANPATIHRPDRMALNPDGSRLFVAADVIGTEDGMITVVDADTYGIVATHVVTNQTGMPYYSDVLALAVSRADRVYVAPAGDPGHHSIEVMDGSSGQILASVPVTDTVVSIAVYSDTLYVSHYQPTGDALMRYDIANAQPVLQKVMPVSDAGRLMVAPDGSALTMANETVVGNLDVHQYDPVTLAETAVYTTAGCYRFSAFTPNSQSLLCMYFYNVPSLHLIDLSSGEVTRRFEDDGSVQNGRSAFPFADGRVAIMYQDRIRILHPADYWVAVPAVFRNSCFSPITDDFSDPGSGWTVRDTGAVAFRYIEGEYNILHRQPYHWAGATRNDRWSNNTQMMSIDGRVASGNGIWGIVFGLNDDWSDLHAFEIRPANQTWTVHHFTSQNGWMPVASGSSPAIQPTGSNTLSLKLEGSNQRLLINGVIATVFGTPIAGRVGLSAGSFGGGVDVRYDNYLFVDAGCPPPAQRSASIWAAQTFSLPMPARR